MVSSLGLFEIQRPAWNHFASSIVRRLTAILHSCSSDLRTQKSHTLV
jgi:hypothetical protein